MPIAEYPFGGSWGYQPLAQFAPSARFGPVDGFARFVDRAHAAGIGVLVDCARALSRRSARPRAVRRHRAVRARRPARRAASRLAHLRVQRRAHGSRRVFAASALAWARRYHVDGIRVDAVASMLYRDYSRAEGEWVPNVHGGRENLESVAFLRMLNDTLHGAAAPAGVVTVAEESTAWPGVTAPTGDGGPRLRLRGTWAGCTTRSRICARTRCIAAITTTGFGLRVRVLRALRAAAVARRGRARQGSLVAKMPGDAWQCSRRCARTSASCGRTPARSCCSWAANSRNGPSSRTTRRRTGTCSMRPRIAACSGSCAT